MNSKCRFLIFNPLFLHTVNMFSVNQSSSLFKVVLFYHGDFLCNNPELFLFMLRYRFISLLGYL